MVSKLSAWAPEGAGACSATRRASGAMGAGAPTGLCSSDCGACGASSQAGTSSAFWIDGGDAGTVDGAGALTRSEEHTSELQSLMRISYAVFCLKKKKTQLQDAHYETSLLTQNNKDNTQYTDKHTQI